MSWRPTPSQARMLFALRGFDSLTLETLREVGGYALVSTTSRSLNALERRGLVVRFYKQKDRHVAADHRAQLTNAGRELVHELDPALAGLEP